MHNLYVYNINYLNGLKYKHNFKNDSFTYFCALCDSLQFWDRAKQIDLSVTTLPEFYILGEDVDLSIEDNLIKLECHDNVSDLLNKKILELNDFLPGVKNLLKVC